MNFYIETSVHLNKLWVIGGEGTIVPEIIGMIETVMGDHCLDVVKFATIMDDVQNVHF